MHRRRITVLFVAVILAFLVVETWLFSLQVVRGGYYADYADRQRLALLPRNVARARILSSDGVALAQDRQVCDVAVVIGRLDPAKERRLRGPLRRLFWVPRRQHLHRIDAADFEIRRERTPTGARLGVRAWSSLEVEVPTDDGYRLYILPREISFPLPPRLVRAAAELAAMTGVPRDELLRKILRAALDVARLRTPVYASTPVLRDVAHDVVAAVETRPERFRGFEVATRCARTWPSGALAPHTVGYVGKFTPADVARAVERYHGWPGRGFFMDLRAGRRGVERSLDDVLRGEFGMECIERDHIGRRQQTLADAPPNAGRDVVLTIDSRLQKIVETALADTPAAAAFLDVRTGHILALVSSPRFDPARLREHYSEYATDPARPLVHRAVSGGYPLGSVFKIVTALAALEKGCVPASVHCSGGLRYGRRTFHCHRRYGHGSVGLTDGFKFSCNVFFYQTAQSVGAEALIAMARRLGLGERTGVRVPGENAGNMPWTARGGELLNLAIGQGRLIVTPLQVARMVAVVANDGVLVAPRIVRELRPFDSEAPAAETLPDPRRPVRLGLSQRSIDAVRLGLYKVVNEPGGTGRRAVVGFDRGFKICGKTSTAQRGGGRPNAGWFAGFAPHDKPRIAFAIVIENLAPGQGGGSSAGPVAREIFDAIPLDLLGLAERGKGE